MRKLIAGLTMALAVTAFAPRPVAAEEDCSREYVECLNDTWDLKGVLQLMADVECFADYIGCVKDEVVG